MSAPMLSWDIGTAYDFFVSLDVLHDPARYGVRGVWAAGMRSRLPAAEREFFEQVMGKVLMGPPLGWLHALPEPKTCSDVLDALGQMPPPTSCPRLPSAGPIGTLRCATSC